MLLHYFFSISVSTQVFAADGMLSTGGYANQFQKMEMMKMLDADGDHMVTSAEADSYFNSLFDKLDKNSDDMLSTKEWAGAGKSTKIDIATGGYNRELRSMKMMKMMDTDGDHQVSREEFLNHQKLIFSKKDTSGDSQISAQEWAARTLGR